MSSRGLLKKTHYARASAVDVDPIVISKYWVEEDIIAGRARAIDCPPSFKSHFIRGLVGQNLE